MTPEESQAFFDANGYWPMGAVAEPRLSPKLLAKRSAERLQLSLRSQFLKGWRAPLHWTAPPLFENPGSMYEELGHEEFCRQVAEYYASIGQASFERASRLHTRWAIKQILRTFETHVRGFKSQSVSSRGKVFYKASGTEKWGAPHRPHYQDILTMPEVLAEDGRVVVDLDAYLKAYAVCPEDLEAASKLTRAKLSQIWGVKL